MNYLNIIISPVFTEKSSAVHEKLDKYVLYVAKKSNKMQIRKAIKERFDVDVKSINVLNVKGKRKSFKGRLGLRKDKRKVYFSLAEGQNLNISEV